MEVIENFFLTKYSQEKYPNYSFALIMGEDNLGSLPKWKNAEKLMSDYQIIVYPRTFEGGTSTSLSVSKIKNQENINIINAPIIEAIEKCSTPYVNSE